jgi:hypothetical protein
LEAVVLDECCLERVELVTPRQSFDGGDPLALLHGSEGHAGQDAAALDMHGACSALAAITSFLCAGQRQLFTQRIKQRHARLDHHRASLTVDRQAYEHALAHFPDLSQPGPIMSRERARAQLLIESNKARQQTLPRKMVITNCSSRLQFRPSRGVNDAIFGVT